MNIRYRLLLTMASITLIIVGASVLDAATRTWTGGVDNDWFVAGNWDSGGAPANYPQAGDMIAVNAGSIDLTNATAELTAFSMNGGTLTFLGWETYLNAATVNISGGTVRPGAAFTDDGPSNRVWIICTDFDLGSDGTINAQARGFAATHGSGAGISGNYGGSHGGKGGNGGTVYGTPELPNGPGSGGSSNPGGGLVLIQATGDVRVDGLIDADGTGTYRGGGSGGGIRIHCKTFAGDGILRARGGGCNTTGWVSGGGGGGRIAVLYDPDHQGNVVPTPQATFSVMGNRGQNSGQPGSLYFPDMQILGPTLDMAGRLMFGQTSPWNIESLTIRLSDMPLSTHMLQPTLYVPADMQSVIVNNNMTIDNSSAMVWSRGAGTLTVNGDLSISSSAHFYFYFDHGVPGSLLIGKDLNLSTSGRLSFYAGATNGVSDHGGLLDLSGRDLTIPNGSHIFMYSNPTNGGSVKMVVGGLDVQTGASINAAGKGYAIGRGPGAGSSGNYGGSHGGKGGNGGPTNGLALVPYTAGSGGSSDPGGGVIWIEAPGGVIEINGVLNANGNGSYRGGGAGGGILLLCKQLSGSGTLEAKGGGCNTTGHSSGSGGGGRIAVLRTVPKGLDALKANNLSGYNPLDIPAEWVDRLFVDEGAQGQFKGEPGTIRFGEHIFGSIFIFR